MLERASVIIKKLQQLVDENATKEVLLTFSQMLVAELQQLQSSNTPQSVSVTMPRRTLIVTELPVEPIVIVEKIKEVLITEPTVAMIEQPEVTENVSTEAETEKLVAEQPQPITWFMQEQEIPEVEPEEFVLEIIEEPTLDANEEVVVANNFEQPLEATSNDYLFETPSHLPTLPEVEVVRVVANETIYTEENEVNNRFKEHKVEVAHLLENTHIKDLRRAISINDKYLFINELFGGDESLYDKSIKQIQGFSILPEATFWIQRELKIKLNWPTNNEVVQLFDQLVKRRFS